MERETALFRKLFGGQRCPVTVHDSDCSIVYANNPAIESFNIPPLEGGPKCYLYCVCHGNSTRKRYCANLTHDLRATKVFEPTPGKTFVRISIPIGDNGKPDGAINIYNEVETPGGISGVFSSEAVEPIVIDDFLGDHAPHCTSAKPLTKKEREVLGLLMRGKLSSEISAIMSITENTVNYHMKNIFGKLGAENRTHAAALGYRRELEKQKLLLREMHHRVKNNFAIMSSLIALRGRSAEQGETSEALSWVDMQLKTFSAFHRMLMEAGPGRLVQMDGFLGEAIGHIRASCLPGSEVAIKTSLIPVQMHMDVALPIAQIVNELLTNAIKHAFASSGGKGCVDVQLRRCANKRDLELIVQDDGCGMPEGFDMHSAGSMGMRIINSLINQIGGSCVLSASRGLTNYTITIPYAENEQ